MRRLIVTSLGLVLLISPVSGRERDASACAPPAWPDLLRSLTPEGDIVLASGRLAKLANIRLPDAPHREQSLSLLRAAVERPVLVQSSGEPDRWGRISVQIRFADEQTSPSLGHGLVAAGLALVDPGLEPLCQPELLAVEEKARVQRLGLWADASYNPINVEHLSLLQGRIGKFVLVEGHIRSIGERPQRTYLNFGGHWAEDFTIIIPKETWKVMTARGHGAGTLKGQRIRARGILQSWQGTALTIAIPDMIEHLEGKRLPR